MKWRTALLAGALCGLLTVQAAAFSDVDGSHWASGAVDRWSAGGIVTGYDDGTFRPDQPIARGELAALLDRVFSWTETAEDRFADLPEDSWCAGHVLRAAAAGVLQGGNGLVRPEDPVTRQEAAVMYFRAFGLAPAESGQTFADRDQIASWAAEEVDTLLARGWIQGTGGGRFSPEGIFTRAQAVTLLDNMAEQFIDRAGAWQEDRDGNVLVASAGVTLQNMEIGGDLIVTGAAVGSEVVLYNVRVSGRILVLAGDGSQVRLTGGTSAALLEARGAGAWVVLDGAPERGRILISGDGAAVDGLETGAEVEIAAGAEGALVNGHPGAGGTVVQAQPGSSLGDVDVEVDIGGGGSGGTVSRTDPPAILSKGPDSVTVEVRRGTVYLLSDELGNETASHTAAEDGSFTFTGLVRGAYTLTAQAPGRRASEPVELYVSNGMIVIDWDQREES